MPENETTIPELVEPRHSRAAISDEIGIFAERIEQLSENVLQVGEGSLYPALHRMDEAGWIRSEWAPSDNNRRARYYRITAAGRRQLAQEETEWLRAADAITRVLRLA